LFFSEPSNSSFLSFGFDGIAKLGKKVMNTAKALLAKAGIRPRKRLGQHFLQDHTIIDRIIAEARLSESDVALEVGAGLGALTIPLLRHVSHLIAIEKDSHLVSILEERLSVKEKQKISLIAGDILKLPLEQLYGRFKQKIKVFGNLPYNISSPFLDKLIANRRYIKTAILMFQYEFAQRLAAPPNRKEYGALSVIVQYYARVSGLMRIEKEAFYPKPKVDSMVLKINFDEPYPSQAKDELLFQTIVRAAFGHRRKTILNSLESGIATLSRDALHEILKQCFIDPKRRAETLDIDEYIRLTASLAAHQTTS
jgi:16S rRNA (adenine1518-N6/adenine1519-N6)-dimethyltransferase